MIPFKNKQVIEMAKNNNINCNKRKIQYRINEVKSLEFLFSGEGIRLKLVKKLK